MTAEVVLRILEYLVEQAMYHIVLTDIVFGPAAKARISKNILLAFSVGKRFWVSVA